MGGSAGNAPMSEPDPMTKHQAAEALAEAVRLTQEKRPEFVFVTVSEALAAYDAAPPDENEADDIRYETSYEWALAYGKLEQKVREVVEGSADSEWVRRKEVLAILEGDTP